MKLNVKGMMCSHCEKRLEKAFLDKGYSVICDHTQGSVDIKDEITLEEAIKIIEDAGFEV